MKIKIDFVTNSSSSSFIVAFPKRVKTIHDVIDYIAPKYAEDVLHDCVAQTPLRKRHKKIEEYIADEIRCGMTDDGFSSYEYRKDLMEKNNITNNDLRDNRLWSDILLEAGNLKEAANSFKQASKFLEKVTDNDWIYIFEYSDETKYGSEMEHGDIFRKLSHIRVSKH